MPLYRIHDRLLVNSKKGEFIEGGPGVVSDLSMISQGHIDVLISGGAISEVKAPPLDELPGWTLRAERLARAGYDAAGFLLGSPDDIIAATREKGVRNWKDWQVRIWQEELKGYLLIDSVEQPKHR